MKTQLLTTSQYIEKVKKVSRQAIVKAAKKEKLHLLPNVVDIKKHGKSYMFVVAI